MYPNLNLNLHGDIIKECPHCHKKNAINKPGTSDLIDLPILCYACSGTIVGVWEKIVGFPEKEKKWDEQYVEVVQDEVNEVKPTKHVMACRFCDFRTPYICKMDDHVRKRHKTKASAYIQRSKEDLKDWSIRLNLLGRMMEWKKSQKSYP